jgi:ppGpp synthetase/RelA/SpoT-type nucleotidyltranferase
MDFWASLEHHLSYKYINEKNGEVARELTGWRKTQQCQLRPVGVK